MRLDTLEIRDRAGIAGLIARRFELVEDYFIRALLAAHYGQSPVARDRLVTPQEILGRDGTNAEMVAGIKLHRAALQLEDALRTLERSDPTRELVSRALIETMGDMLRPLLERPAPTP